MQHILNDEEWQKYMQAVNPPPLSRDLLDRDAFGTPERIMYLPNVVDFIEDTRRMNRGAPSVSLMSMLCMRMKWGEFNRSASFGEISPSAFTFTAVHETARDANHKIIVFLVKDGKPIVLEDDPNDFPTDALVAKIRLLELSK